MLAKSRSDPVAKLFSAASRYVLADWIKFGSRIYICGYVCVLSRVLGVNDSVPIQHESGLSIKLAANNERVRWMGQSREGLAHLDTAPVRMATSWPSWTPANDPAVSSLRAIDIAIQNHRGINEKQAR